jgi:hypothetical protein
MLELELAARPSLQATVNLTLVHQRLCPRLLCHGVDMLRVNMTPKMYFVLHKVSTLPTNLIEG